MIILIFAGQAMFNKPFDIITEPRYKDDEITGDKVPTDRLKKDTLCFHTFMLMNIINMINCRVVKENEDNVFKTIFDNPTFLFVFLLEMLIQNGTVLIAGEFTAKPWNII